MIVYTGNGKGKTTAAIGLAVRAWGQGLRPIVIQFIKATAPDKRRGEQTMAQSIGIPWVSHGAGWIAPYTLDKHKQTARLAWASAKRAVLMPDVYDMVVLDEFTYVVNLGWLEEDALAWLKANLPKHMALVVTGRDAAKDWMEWADTVTDMQEVKHAFHSGVQAEVGIEY